jgi:hypothetical protein
MWEKVHKAWRFEEKSARRIQAEPLLVCPQFDKAARL